MLYRIYTEYIARDKIIAAFAASFESFTTFDGIGYWKGKPEECLIIEVVTSDSVTLRKVCEWVKWYNKQEAVLIVAVQETSELI